MLAGDDTVWNEAFEPTEEQQVELAQALSEADRGDGIDGWQLLTELCQGWDSGSLYTEGWRDSLMNVEIEEIAERALMLSPAARAHLAEILLESLDYEEDFSISSAWMSEVRRRCHEIDSGAIELLPGEEALAELQKKYS